jgi:competence ComEA-like helix-hairpin-helix protein
MVSQGEPQPKAGPRFEYAVIYVLCVALLGALGVLWLRQAGVFRPEVVVEHAPEDRMAQPIELNSAPWWELTQVTGIGEARAKEIVALRERKGGFTSLDELTAIRGITPALVDQMREIVRITPRTEAEHRP